MSRELIAAAQAEHEQRWGDAIRWLDRALDAGTDADAKLDALHRRSGVALVKLGRYREAVAALDRAIADTPKAAADLALSYYTRSMAHLQLGIAVRSVADASAAF